MPPIVVNQPQYGRQAAGETTACDLTVASPSTSNFIATSTAEEAMNEVKALEEVVARLVKCFSESHETAMNRVTAIEEKAARLDTEFSLHSVRISVL